MAQPNQNQQVPPKTSVPVSQAPHPNQTPYLTEEHAKEVILETLIKFNLIPRAEKQKAITLE